MTHRQSRWLDYRRAISVVIFLLTAFTIAILFIADCFGTLDVLPQGFACVAVLMLGTTIGMIIWVQPEYLAHPVTVLLCGSIYFFLLDAALQREVEWFAPELLLETEAALFLFIVIVLSVWYCLKLRSSPLELLLGKSGVTLTGRSYCRTAIIVFSLEMLRRLYFVDFKWSEFLREMLLARSGGSFRRLTSIEGDWKVFLQPAEQLFLLVPFLVDRAFARRGISIAEKTILIAFAAAQLLTSFLDGNRGVLVESLALPVFARATAHDESARKWLIALALTSFLLVPILDLMVHVRAKGWTSYTGDEQISWNPLYAHRDDNFYRTVVTFDYAHRHGGVWGYKGLGGFLDGLREEAFLWVSSPVPRVLWPGKPTVYDIADLTKAAWITEGIVGELFRTGGVLLLAVGGVLLGWWMSCLECLFYRIDKSDAATLQYGLLMLATFSVIRDPTPWVTMPILLTVLLIALVSRLLNSQQRQNGVRLSLARIQYRECCEREKGSGASSVHSPKIV